jgi:hypothetical protein
MKINSAMERIKNSEVALKVCNSNRVCLAEIKPSGKYFYLCIDEYRKFSAHEIMLIRDWLNDLFDGDIQETQEKLVIIGSDKTIDGRSA